MVRRDARDAASAERHVYSRKPERLPGRQGISRTTSSTTEAPSPAHANAHDTHGRFELSSDPSRSEAPGSPRARRSRVNASLKSQKKSGRASEPDVQVCARRGLPDGACPLALEGVSVPALRAERLLESSNAQKGSEFDGRRLRPPAGGGNCAGRGTAAPWSPGGRGGRQARRRSGSSLLVRGRESAEKRRKEVRRQEKQKDKADRKKQRRVGGPEGEEDGDTEGVSADGVAADGSLPDASGVPAGTGVEPSRVNGHDVAARSALDHEAL
jgi:hypothetical protein